MFLAKRKMLTYKNTLVLVILGSTVGVFSLLFLCSCTPKKMTTPGVQYAPKPQGVVPLRSSFLEEAKQFNTLVPLGFRCIKKHVAHGHAGPMLILRYEGSQAPTKVASFYQRELEAAGWDFTNFSTEQEGLFFCRKGTQECAINVRTKGATIITITYHTKSSLHSSNDFASINKPLTF